MGVGEGAPYFRRSKWKMEPIPLLSLSFLIRNSWVDREFSSRRIAKPVPEVIKLFSCSTQLSMKFFPLINIKMPTIVIILPCMSGKNSILGLHEP